MIKTQCFNFNNIYSNNNESGPNCPVVNTEVFFFECLSSEVSYLEGSAHPLRNKLPADAPTPLIHK
jgi:hypothetical protein